MSTLTTPRAATRGAPPRPSRARPRWGRAALLTAVALLLLFPLYWLVATALAPRGDLQGSELRLWLSAIDLSNFSRPLAALPFGTWYVNSVAIAVVAVLITVVVNLLAGFVLAKLEFRGRNVVFLVLLATLMIPVQVVMIPQFRIVAELGWLNTYQGLIVPGLASAFGTFLFRQHFLTLPGEIMEAARLEGAGHLQLLWRIVLPLSRPVFVTVGLISLVYKWNDFLWPLIVTNRINMRVLPVGLAYLYDQEGNSQWGIIMAATIFVVLPIMVIFAWAQRHIIEGLTAGATKG